MADIISILADMQRGQVISDINSKFEEALQAVFGTGKKGEVTIKLFIEPSKFSLGGGVIQVDIEHECKITKKPELAVGSSTFFVDDEGKLSRNAPGQETFVYDAEREEREAKKNV